MEGHEATVSFYINLLLLLAGAVVAVPLFNRLGLGSVLGYLAAGVLFGPILGLFDDPETILSLAEFGVVLFLFIIGLELNPKRLWQLRNQIFGLGLLQVLVCGTAIIGIAFLYGNEWRAAIVIGFGLALSSTALVMQMLNERGETATPHGRRAFTILLFQDLAIVPLLLLVNLLSPNGEEVTITDAAEKAVIAVLCIAALVLTGRYLLTPGFRLLARLGGSEIMTAGALLVVLAAGLLMDFAGMSMAMGAFIAGVMLAESSYRHELEADIEPFRALLLGLFFIAVGLSLDIGIVAENWVTVVTGAIAGMVAKAVIIYSLARLFRSSHAEAVRVALYLPQFGEFAFVLFTTAVAAGVMNAENAAILIAVVTLSMALTPVVMLLAPWLARSAPADSMEEDYSDAGSEVLIIGFGRFGQLVAQMMLAQHVGVTIIDADPNRVREAGRFGARIYFGDGTRPSVLRAAGAGQARAIAICTDKPQTTNAIARLVKAEFPDAQVLARAYDRGHAIELIKADVDYQLRETVESALVFGAAALRALDISDGLVEDTLRDVRSRDKQRLEAQIRGDFFSGREQLYPVQPEPLSRPERPSRRLDQASEADDPAEEETQPVT